MKYLNEGDKIQVQGSGKKPYDIRKIGGIVDCSCPAWKNMGGSTSNRVCKHIRANVDPTCLLIEAQAVAGVPAGQMAVLVGGPRLTKTGKVSTAVGGAVVKDTAPPVLLAHTWTDEDPTGWWMSEKLDGVRAWWDGKQFISRLGNTYHAPQWFLDLMPAGIVLDGELWVGRKQFQRTISIVKKLVPDEVEWEEVKYMVFDAPKLSSKFEDRLGYLDSILIGRFGVIRPVKQEVCFSVDHLKKKLIEVENIGAEGLMLRAPGSMYEEGRSKTLLKVKTFFDAEAVVIGHEPGKGKHKGRMGAVNVRMLNGVEFAVGSGFSDKERENPPPIGAIITFRYQELSNDDVPRFPTYVSVRDYE